jgi:hypothetical protein
MAEPAKSSENAQGRGKLNLAQARSRSKNSCRDRDRERRADLVQGGATEQFKVRGRKMGGWSGSRVVRLVGFCLTCLVLCFMVPSAAYALTTNDVCAITSTGAGANASTPATLTFTSVGGQAPTFAHGGSTTLTELVDSVASGCDASSGGFTPTSEADGNPLALTSFTVISVDGNIALTFAQASCDADSGGSNCNSAGDQYYNVTLNSVRPG